MGGQLRSQFSSAFSRFTGYLPNVVSAILIAAIGYGLSRAAAALTRRVLTRVGFDRWATRHLRAQPVESKTWSGSAICGSIVFGLGLLVTATLVANNLELYALGSGLGRILAFIPRLLVACIIVGVAVAVGNVLARAVAAMSSLALAKATRVAVVVLAAFMALDELGDSHSIVVTTFTALLGAAAVAIAIAFGVGNIGLAREYTQRWAERSRARVQAPEPELMADTTEPSTRH
jgi:hypothetical protein